MYIKVFKKFISPFTSRLGVARYIFSLQIPIDERKQFNKRLIGMKNCRIFVKLTTHTHICGHLDVRCQHFCKQSLLISIVCISNLSQTKFRCKTESKNTSKYYSHTRICGMEHSSTYVCMWVCYYEHVYVVNICWCLHSTRVFDLATLKVHICTYVQT